MATPPSTDASAPSAAVERLAGDPRLDPARRALGALAAKVAPAGPRRSALRGERYGHPLHPTLTDLPIGLFTSSFLLDVLGGRAGRRAARRLVGLGLVAAVPTTVTGLAEWADADEGTQRIGAVHAASNAVGLVLYLRSWRARRRGRHLRGAAWGFAGAGALTVGGYLGGHLSYVRGMGVQGTDRSPSRSGPGAAGEPTTPGAPEVGQPAAAAPWAGAGATPAPPPEAAAGAPSDRTTLTAVVASYEAAGFTTAFVIGDGATITCRSCGTTSPAGMFTLESLRRLEGASDPADMVAVAAVACPSCHSKGLLVLRYGPEAGEEESLVYLALDDARQGEGSVPAAVAPGEQRSPED